MIASDIINSDRIDVKFDSIGGLEDIKQSLFELVILPLRRPELFKQGKLLSPQKGILLYGPPGTGKTMLAKAIAKECGATFINVRVSNLMGKWFGDAEKLENARVLVMAATNHPQVLDEAIVRRLPQAFEIGLPNVSDRVRILKVILKGESLEGDIDYDHIASLCDGFSGSDLNEVCKQAAYFPTRDLLQEEKKKKGHPLTNARLMNQSDLENALFTSKKMKASRNRYQSLIAAVNKIGMSRR